MHTLAASSAARSRSVIQLVLDALNVALATRRPPKNLVHHSDQGLQYTCIQFGKRYREAGVRPPKGSVGDAYDNAMAESFFATLECELPSHHLSGARTFPPNRNKSRVAFLYSHDAEDVAGKVSQRGVFALALADPSGDPFAFLDDGLGLLVGEVTLGLTEHEPGNSFRLDCKLQIVFSLWAGVGYCKSVEPALRARFRALLINPTWL
jgi:hypothetical protein